MIIGDYFIAELIEAQDEAHRTIVADVSMTFIPHPMGVNVTFFPTPWGSL